MATHDELVSYARSQAVAHGIDADIFVRQIDQESNFDPNAGPSPAGAEGIAQIVPHWHPGVDPWDPFASLTYAAALDRSNLTQYGDYTLMLVAYNGGGGAVQAWQAGQPYAESRDYVAKILGGSTGPTGGTATTGGLASIATDTVAVLVIAGVLLILAAD